VLEQAARDGWLLLFDHDPRARVGRVEVDAGRFSFREIPGH
jgi:hypothetical protein